MFASATGKETNSDPMWASAFSLGCTCPVRDLLSPLLHCSVFWLTVYLRNLKDLECNCSKVGLQKRIHNEHMPVAVYESLFPRL
jgi:hypothetical protein